MCLKRLVTAVFGSSKPFYTLRLIQSLPTLGYHYHSSGLQRVAEKPTHVWHEGPECRYDGLK